MIAFASAARRCSLALWLSIPALAACRAPEPVRAATRAVPVPFAEGAAWPGVRLPHSSSRALQPAAALRVALSREALLVEGAAQPIATSPADGRRGFDARFKARGTVDDLEIAPLRRVLEAMVPRAGRPPPLLLGLDSHASYRTFSEIALTAMRSGYSDLWLAVEGPGGLRAIAIPSTANARDGSAVRTSTGFAVIVGQDGFYVKAAGTPLLEGCEPDGPFGVTVPRRRGYDYDALSECARLTKHRVDALGDQPVAHLVAGPDIELQVVVGAADAIRSHGERTLFPEVVFSVLGGR